MMRITDYFQVGGSLESGHPSYVEREADFQLIDCLEKDKYCFVLNSRQMGKSSLMLHTSEKLISKNINCAFVDLSVLGLYHNVEQNRDEYTRLWYKSFVFQLLETLDLDTQIDLDSWWKSNKDLTPESQFSKFVSNVLLVEITNKLVIFVDEIDSISNQPFKDSFFALLRGFYNQRGINPQYKRISFCLIGVGTPYDLIKDKTKTPFNIGESIELFGLTFENAKKSLINGLKKGVEESEKVLRDIIYWTDGQPFLTQKLCKLVVENAVDNRVVVEQIVREFIINNWRQKGDDIHFKTINDRLLSNENIIIKLLDIYEKVLQGEKIIVDNSIEQNQLRLSGLVRKERGYLKVFNRIYEEIFNREWIAEQLDNGNLCRPYFNELNQWLNSRLDEEYLLIESQLTEAENWAKNKSLATIDYQFIDASRQNIRQQQQLKRKQEKEKRARQKKRNQIISSVGIMISLVLGIYAVFTYRQWNLQENIKVYNREVEQLNLSEQLDSLVEALIISEKIRKSCKYNQQLDRSFCTESIPELNHLLDRIQINNQSNIHQEINRENPTQVGITKITYLEGEEEKIISGDNKGKLNQWNLENNNHKNDYELPSNREIKDIVIDNKEKTIFVGMSESAGSTKGGGIIAFDDEGQLIKVFENDGVASLGISTDGKILVSGDDNGKISLWQKDGTLITTWQGHRDIVNDVTFSPNDRVIASASKYGTVKLWSVNPFFDRQNTDDMLIATFNEHKSSVNTLAFHPDGNLLASASGGYLGINNSEDKKVEIKLWLISDFIIDRQQGKNSSQCITPQDKCDILVTSLSGHKDSINDLVFSSDGQYLISASDDKTIKLWSIERIDRNSKDEKKVRGNLLETFKTPNSKVKTIAFHPERETFISGNDNGTIEVWQILPRNKHLISAGILSSDKQKLILSEVKNNQNNTISTIDRNYNEQTPTLNSIENKSDLNNQQNTDIATSNSIQNSRETIVNNNSNEQIPPLNKNNGLKSINSITTSDNEQNIFVGTDSGNIYKLNRQQNKNWQEIKKTNAEQAYRGKIIALDFNSQKQQLISLGINYEKNREEPNYVLKLWRQNGNLIKEINPDNQKELTAVSFNSFGNEFITASSDGKIELWDLNSSEDNNKKTIIDSNRDNNSDNKQWRITALKMSPNSKLIAIAAIETSAKNTSNLASGNEFQSKIEIYTDKEKLLTTFKVTNSKFVNIYFSEDEKTILTIDSLGQLKLWDLDLEKLIERGCSWLKDYSFSQIEDRNKQDEIKKICSS